MRRLDAASPSERKVNNPILFRKPMISWDPVGTRFQNRIRFSTVRLLGRGAGWVASESPREPSRARRGHEKRLLLLDGVRFREFYRNPRNPRLTIEINVSGAPVMAREAVLTPP